MFNKCRQRLYSVATSLVTALPDSPTPRLPDSPAPRLPTLLGGPYQTSIPAL
ncbi:hypothetical protein FOTG_16587 [Fusarium oxysporum f. sp. vasinfectum 25433]|uniref:Uncharacterized protein n=1 Tax=Fusarium oxysporum f. sp. vasinfectum 25433 TaxID=1089449 RepID=X0KN74_FUSOX|nr:hypothetical protein FOTG_16587 [Fusarium oxysporum f. sp. vasinfectum 25433]